MMDGGELIQQVQFGLAVAGLGLAAAGALWSLVSIVRRRQGPFLTEFTTVAMSTGVALWALKFLVPRGPLRDELQPVSTAGFVLFMLAAVAIVLVRRREATAREPTPER